MKKIYAIIIGITLLVLSGSVMVDNLDSNLILTAKASEETTTASSPEKFQPTELYLSRQTVFEMLKIDKDSTVLVGDSIVQRNEWNEMIPDIPIVNRGIDYDTIGGVSYRIDSITKDKPKNLILSIGINDIYNNIDKKVFLKQYEEVLNKIKKQSSDTKIFIVSILPVNNSVYSHPVQNQTIQDFNSELAKLAKNSKVEYIEINPHLLNEDKTELNEEYTYDGIHLNGNGYKIYVDSLVEKLKG